MRKLYFTKCLSVVCGTLMLAIAGFPAQGIALDGSGDPIALSGAGVEANFASSAILPMQGLSVTGKVTNEANEPLPGVNILIKGTASGTVTDLDGEYRIQVSDEDAVLTFSYIGYVTQDVALSGRTTINVVLAEDLHRLDEVVVVGYGTMKKSDLTGSVVSAPIEDFRQAPNVSMIQALQGSVPGLNVGMADQAGESPGISIRGQNSISGSSVPLIVVDGVIYRGGLLDVNPADVASIEILKDASSAAIFGSEAANGVIMITTKSGAGHVGKPRITYSGSHTIQKPSHELRPMNREAFLNKFRDAFWEENREGPDYLTPVQDWNVYAYFKTSQSVEGYDNGTDMDWYDLLTRQGQIQNHSIGITGGGDKVNYYTSFGYTKHEGWLLNEDYERYTLRVNLDSHVTDWLKVGTQSFFTLSDFSNISPPLSRLWWAPINSAYDENGDLVLEPTGLGINPLLDIEHQDNFNKRMHMFGNVYADFAAPFLEGLTYRIKYGRNFKYIRDYNFNPNSNNFQGTGRKSHDLVSDWNFDNILNFKRSINGVHNLDITLVSGRESRAGETTDAYSSIFINDVLGYHALEAGSALEQSTSSGAWSENSLYTMGRLVYNYKGKYLFTGTYRRDGFSGFGESKKWATFPSAAVGWVLSEENFVKGAVPALDFLKLRASYGTNGNRTVSRYQTLSKVSYHYSYIYGDGGNSELGQWISSMANEELGWETTTGLNLGVDFELFNHRILGSIDFYNTDTHDLIYAIRIPTITGFSSISTNIGELHNHGLEVTLTTMNVKTQHFDWSSTFNFSRNRNRVTTILGRDDDGDGKEDDIISSGIFIGHPLGVMYNYEIVGMYQLGDDIPNGFYPGNYKIADVNGDGMYTPADDRKILGYTAPGYRFSIQNRLAYKNWSLSIFLNSIQGGKDYYYGNGSPQGNWRDVAEKFASGNSFEWDYWMPENPNAKHERLGFKSSFATILPVQRSFVRLQDISLAYTFPKSIIGESVIEGLKIYVSGKNLHTWTKWEGWDPETGIGMVEGGRPVMSSYALGVVLDF